jgi:hypothetical protein
MFLSSRKLKQCYLINRSGDYRELSVCVLRFFHSRFNSTTIFMGPMGDFKVPCLFFRSEAWHKLQLCRTRRPVLGTCKPFGMSRHVCVFIIGCISVQSEMAYTQLLQQMWKQSNVHMVITLVHLVLFSVVEFMFPGVSSYLARFVIVISFSLLPTITNSLTASISINQLL